MKQIKCLQYFINSCFFSVLKNLINSTNYVFVYLRHNFIIIIIKTTHIIFICVLFVIVLTPIEH